MTLSAGHVRVDGALRLKLSGDVSSVGGSPACVSQVVVRLARYSPQQRRFVGVARTQTNARGHYVAKVRDRGGVYRARVGASNACGAAEERARHGHS